MSPLGKRVVTTLIAVWAVSAGGQVSAQTPPAVQEAGPKLSDLYACSDVADDAARLACFDKAVATLRDAETVGDLAVVSRAQIEQVEREAFGLSVPSASQLAASVGVRPNPDAGTEAPKKAQPLDSVTLAVKSIATGRDGKLRVVMENGQVWRQIDSERVRNLGKGPWQAEIKRGVFGSFFLKINDRPAVRARREE
ncbi:MAG: hypothetical protein R3C52_08675 [Hyphomonadaceae bacterium]